MNYYMSEISPIFTHVHIVDTDLQIGHGRGKTWVSQGISDDSTDQHGTDLLSTSTRC